MTSSLSHRLSAGAACLLAAALLAGCNKPGDQGGGTTDVRTQSSPPSAPMPTVAEPSPGVAPSAAASAGGR